jgi:transcriptional regulator with XRE-family HTH domain
MDPTSMSEVHPREKRNVGRPRRTGPFLGENLRTLRILKKLSLLEMARRMAAGGRPVAPLTIRRWENNEYVPRNEDIAAMAAILGVPKTQLTREQTVTWKRARRTTKGKKARGA